MGNKWQELGTMAMNMAALSALEVEYYEENGDDDDGIACWTANYEKWLERLTEWIHLDSKGKISLALAYLEALEIVSARKRDTDNPLEGI